MIRFRFSIFCIIIFLSNACNSQVLIDRIDENPGFLEAEDPIINLSSQYVVVLGDLQEYTKNDSLCYFYQRTVEWITKQINSGCQICSILQTGDVTNNNAESQWERFKNSTAQLSSKVPFFACIGNHDYSWTLIDKTYKITDRSNSLINKYCFFENLSSKILSYYKSTSLENYVADLSLANGVQLLVLEYGPRDEVINWADLYLTDHSNTKYILMTHEWLSGDGSRIGNEAQSRIQLSGYSSCNTPEDSWNRLVKKHNNVVCVLCGHAFALDKSLVSQNDNGRWVTQLLFNIQHLENGGNGLVQLWEFPKGSNYVIIRSYDTINRKWYWQNPRIFTVDIEDNSIS